MQKWLNKPIEWKKIKRQHKNGEMKAKNQAKKSQATKEKVSTAKEKEKF